MKFFRLSGPSSPPDALRRTGTRIAVAGLVLMLGLVGYWMLFANFAVYDDEGYILISARSYFLHGHLYETVYSQYGPAFYVLLDVIQHLSGLVDHTGARLITLIFWLGTAGFCARLVWRQTLSLSLSLFTLGATFLYLYFVTDEPFHPGSAVFFALAASLHLILRRIENDQLATAAGVAGGTAAILLLTKINVGLFYGAALATWLATVVPTQRRSWARGVALIALIGFATALMHTHWRETWVQAYLILFASGSAAILVNSTGTLAFPARPAGWFVAAAVFTATAILGEVWWRGTSLSGLWEGVLLGPLRHPGNYSFPVDWRPGVVPFAVLSLAMALAWPWLKRRCPGYSLDCWIVGVRLVLAGVLLVAIALLMDFRAVGAIFSYLAPVVWIWVLPLDELKLAPRTLAGRGLLAIVLILQFLHAYPVGGSQETWGTFLFIPLVAIGLGDVRRWLELRPLPALTRLGPWRITSVALSVVIFGKVGWTMFAAGRAYFANPPLGLPGAASLHLPEEQRATYRILALNAAAHTDSLFSAPGMFSFNLWTDLPAPTEKNTTLWFTLLNVTDQRAIIAQLDRSPRAGLILQSTLVELMQANGIRPHGILWDYLHENFHARFRSDGFAFCVRNGRNIAPFNVAWLRPPEVTAAAAQARDTVLSFFLILEGSPIAAIEIRNLGAPAPSRILNAANAEIDLGPINSSGVAQGAPRRGPWPWSGQGLTHVSVHFDRQGLALNPATTLLYLLDRQGKRLGEVRLSE